MTTGERRGCWKAGTHLGSSAFICGCTLALCVAQPAAAHVPQLRGRLIDLVSQSDLVIVGTVESVRAIDGRVHDTTVRPQDSFVGTVSAETITFRANRRFAPGERFVFFLRRDGAGWECVQPPGTVFPSRPADDAAYRATVVAIQRALPVAAAERPAALRAAIIPALSATAAPLRYHAVLELGALAHHGLTESERQSLQRLVADPTTDAAIRPIVASLLSGEAEPRTDEPRSDAIDAQPALRSQNAGR